MKTNLTLSLLLVLILTLIISACGNTPAPAPTRDPEPTSAPAEMETDSATPVPLQETATADLCSSPQIEEIAQKVQKHMREFDDASTLASNVPQSQLSTSIADLQRIRRAAEEELVPTCLETLKGYQISHMEAVINTLLAFLRSTDPRSIDCVEVENNTEEAAVCQSIASARELHDQYIVELARVLGMTVSPATQGAPTP